MNLGPGEAALVALRVEAAALRREAAALRRERDAALASLAAYRRRPPAGRGPAATGGDGVEGEEGLEVRPGEASWKMERVYSVIKSQAPPERES